MESIPFYMTLANDDITMHKDEMALGANEVEFHKDVVAGRSEQRLWRLVQVVASCVVET